MATVIFETIHKPIEARIIEAACIYWNIDKSYFAQNFANRTATHRKAIVYYLLRQNTEYSYRFIAESLGFKSHQAVMRLIENIDSEKCICRKTARDIERIGQLAQALSAELLQVNIRLVSKLAVAQ